MFINHYQILDIQNTATKIEIKKAYRVGAMKAHPDKNNNTTSSNKLFKQLKDSYNILMDDKKRNVFDQELEILVAARNRNNEQKKTEYVYNNKKYVYNRKLVINNILAKEGGFVYVSIHDQTFKVRIKQNIKNGTILRMRVQSNMEVLLNVFINSSIKKTNSKKQFVFNKHMLDAILFGGLLLGFIFSI